MTEPCDQIVLKYYVATLEDRERAAGSARIARILLAEPGPSVRRWTAIGAQISSPCCCF
jgi:hypothetical protein